MINVVPSLNLAMDDLAVAYDHSPDASIAASARLLRARNPYVTLPPASIGLDGIASIQMSTASLHDAHRAIAATALKEGEKGRLNMDQRGEELGALKPLMDLARWLALGSTLALPRGFLVTKGVESEPGAVLPRGLPQDGVIAALNLLAADEGTKEGGDSGPGTWFSVNSEKARALKLLTLWGSFDSMRNSSFLSGEIDTPTGVAKDVYPVVERVARLAAILLVIELSIAAAPLREIARFLSLPQLAPVLDYMPPAARDDLKERIAFVLGLPMHPWLAEAERMALPARRYTEWGVSSMTIGLARGGLWERLKAFGAPRGGSPVATDLRDLVLGLLIPSEFLTQARDLEWTLRSAKEAHITGARALLGFTSPGAAPALHLHGQTLKFFIQTGSAASEALPDALSLMTRPRLVFMGPTGRTEAAGPLAPLHYNARFWTTRENTINSAAPLFSRPLVTPPLYVTPQMPAYEEGFALRQLLPAMLQPVDEAHFFGDEDAVYDEYSPDGAARLLGLADAGALAAVPVLVKGLTHLFGTDAKGQLARRPELKGVSRIFHSSRTRKPWKTPVVLPLDAMPTRVIAFDARNTAPIVHDIEAYCMRTPELPVLGAALEPLADSAAIAAAKGIGV